MERRQRHPFTDITRSRNMVWYGLRDRANRYPNQFGREDYEPLAPVEAATPEQTIKVTEIFNGEGKTIGFDTETAPFPMETAQPLKATLT